MPGPRNEIVWNPIASDATKGNVITRSGGGKAVIRIDAICNMLAMARAHQALERADAQEQARNQLAGCSSDTSSHNKKITPPDEDTDRKIKFP